MYDDDPYDLSFLTGDQDLVHYAICAKQGISKPSVGIAKDSLPKCRDCYLLSGYYDIFFIPPQIGIVGL